MIHAASCGIQRGWRIAYEFVTKQPDRQQKQQNGNGERQAGVTTRREGSNMAKEKFQSEGEQKEILSLVFFFLFTFRASHRQQKGIINGEKKRETAAEIWLSRKSLPWLSFMYPLLLPASFSCFSPSSLTIALLTTASS
jgi:hypothetical protein